MAQMYEVFTENGWIVFTKKWKKEFKPKNTEVICEKDFRIKDMREIRLKTPIRITLLIISEEPKLTFGNYFKNYEFVQAAGGLVKRKNTFLFIKRHGKWDIPKGKRDKGENLKTCAIREVTEECGIDKLTIESKICKTYHTYSWDGKPVLKESHWYRMSYSGKKKLVPQTEEAITKAVWMKHSDWNKVEKNTFETILQVLKKY